MEYGEFNVVFKFLKNVGGREAINLKTVPRLKIARKNS